MSGHTYKKTIESELRKLNEAIDLKIIKGVSYVKESRRHKFLLRQLKGFALPSSWFQKSFNLVSTFVL